MQADALVLYKLLCFEECELNKRDGFVEIRTRVSEENTKKRRKY
jgi:hypothetical protein